MKKPASIAELRTTLVSLALACLFLPVPLSAQSAGDTAVSAARSAGRELDFIHYLAGRNQHEDALFLMERLESNPSLPPAWRDSLHYLQGWSYYSLKELAASASHFVKVGKGSSQYLKSRFFAAYDHLFLGDRQTAAGLLTGTAVPPGLADSMGRLTDELRALEMAGIALLDRDYNAFREQSSLFTYSYYTLVKEQYNLLKYNEMLGRFRPRSPWKAGLLSALVPGSGKIYSRKPGEGVAAFLVVACLGLITWENCRIDGLSDWKTVTAGGIFSVYYVGNILGSVYAAKRYNKAYLEALDNRILFDLHIPLRNIFD